VVSTGVEVLLHNRSDLLGAALRNHRVD